MTSADGHSRGFGHDFLDHINTTLRDRSPYWREKVEVPFWQQWLYSMPDSVEKYGEQKDRAYVYSHQPWVWPLYLPGFLWGRWVG